MSEAVRHEASKNRFLVVIDGVEAVLEYRASPNSIDFFRTYVPDALRGKGLAALLVAEGLRYAKEKNLRVIPTCSYVKKYVETH